MDFLRHVVVHCERSAAALAARLRECSAPKFDIYVSDSQCMWSNAAIGDSWTPPDLDAATPADVSGWTLCWEDLWSAAARVCGAVAGSPAAGEGGDLAIFSGAPLLLRCLSIRAAFGCWLEAVRDKFAARRSVVRALVRCGRHTLVTAYIAEVYRMVALKMFAYLKTKLLKNRLDRFWQAVMVVAPREELLGVSTANHAGASCSSSCSSSSRAGNCDNSRRLTFSNYMESMQNRFHEMVSRTRAGSLFAVQRLIQGVPNLFQTRLERRVWPGVDPRVFVKLSAFLEHTTKLLAAKAAVEGGGAPDTGAADLVDHGLPSTGGGEDGISSGATDEDADAAAMRADRTKALLTKVLALERDGASPRCFQRLQAFATREMALHRLTDPSTTVAARSDAGFAPLLELPSPAPAQPSAGRAQAADPPGDLPNSSPSGQRSRAGVRHGQRDLGSSIRRR